MYSSNLRYLAALLPLVAAVLFLGNSGGPAANGNFKTGAPSAGGGTEQTCSQCHSSGSFGEPVINVSFAQDGMPVELTEYTPGETYRVTVAIGYGATAPAAYGFSSQFLNIANSPATPVGVPGNPDAATQSTVQRVLAETTEVLRLPSLRWKKVHHLLHVISPQFRIPSFRTQPAVQQA